MMLAPRWRCPCGPPEGRGCGRGASATCTKGNVVGAPTRDHIVSALFAGPQELRSALCDFGGPSAPITSEWLAFALALWLTSLLCRSRTGGALQLERGPHGAPHRGRSPADRAGSITAERVAYVRRTFFGTFPKTRAFTFSLV